MTETIVFESSDGGNSDIYFMIVLYIIWSLRKTCMRIFRVHRYCVQDSTRTSLYKRLPFCRNHSVSSLLRVGVSS